jgi:acetylornithine deacetylase/succinyl-diaminopimelate desuccinylase-like protein
MKRVYDYIDDHWMETIEDLKLFCQQPSISAQGVGMSETVPLLVDLLKKRGIDTRVIPVEGGYPMVYGELKGRSERTLLFYNHYDVQPPEPLNEWDTPPFEPTIVEGTLRARGVSDDKGDIIARLLAIESFQRTKGELPVSIKFLIEGEEEIGSPNIARFVEQNRDLLKADACIWECGGVNWRNEPMVSLGVKGILYVQLEARGASVDLHSSMGAVIPNPAWRLVWALSSIKDIDENILVQGFYNDVIPPPEPLMDAIRVMPLDDENTRQSLGLKQFVKGVSGFEYKRRHVLEPSCTICGLDSGYTGPGSKTVLPAVARAKLDFRLVPNQRPDDILAKLRAHFDSNGFEDISIAAGIEGENPARTPLDSPFVRLVCDATREVYGVDPVVVPSMAGSGPMYSFTDTLGLPTVLIGVMYPDSRPHAPNEHIRLGDFVLGAKQIAAVLERMGSWTE